MPPAAGFEVIPGVLADAELTSLRAAAPAFRRGRAGARHLMEYASTMKFEPGLTLQVA